MATIASCCRSALAPPCGTCSQARNIKLRDSHGRPLKGPIPLRSEQFPEGLLGLSGNDLARVSSANRLYDFLSVIVSKAVARGLIVVVENPRSSLFWRTRFWKAVARHFCYYVHQACAYGGCRPKWTVLASNHPAFQQINMCCPGESPQHVHEPWGLVGTDQGSHFSTSRARFCRSFVFTWVECTRGVLCASSRGLIANHEGCGHSPTESCTYSSSGARA